MAAAPWRCSQCGTVNEPVANSCRTCGKWPSLFDLDDNVLDEDDPFEPVAEPELPVEATTTQTYEAPEPVTVDVEPYEAPAAAGAPEEPKRRRFAPPPTDPVMGEGESDRPRWVSWIIPIAVVAYFVISTILNNR